GVAMGRINSDGKIELGPIVPVDTSGGRPSELCWVSIMPDDRFIFATNFGYGYITSFVVDGDVIRVASDPACTKVPGNGAWRALNGTVSSGPSDSWVSPDGRHLYQIYGNASTLVGYAI